jgi:hypothetical protein
MRNRTLKANASDRHFTAAGTSGYSRAGMIAHSDMERFARVETPLSRRGSLARPAAFQTGLAPKVECRVVIEDGRLRWQPLAPLPRRASSQLSARRMARLVAHNWVGSSTYIPRSTTAASYKLWVRIALGGVNSFKSWCSRRSCGGVPMLNFRDISGLRSFLLATALPLSVLATGLTSA